MSGAIESRHSLTLCFTAVLGCMRRPILHLQARVISRESDLIPSQTTRSAVPAPRLKSCVHSDHHSCAAWIRSRGTIFSGIASVKNTTHVAETSLQTSVWIYYQRKGRSY